MKKAKEQEKQVTVKERILEYKEKYPGIKSMSISYNGSGDSFDDFYDTDFEKYNPDSKDIEVQDIEDLCWFAINNSEADFNNEGSQGVIIIDFEDLVLKIDNKEIVLEYIPSGELEFQDEILTKES